LEIVSFDELNSTQLYLIDKIKSKEYKSPIVVIADNQTSGIGSRENSWCACKGDLLFSFALPFKLLPDDLPMESISIYFAFIMKEVLSHYDNRVFLKWPNDFYVQDSKVGGCVTKVIDKDTIVGIGINLVDCNREYTYLNIPQKPYEIVTNYLLKLKEMPSWKYIFSKYQVEFNLNKEFDCYIDGDKKSFKNATLCSDGSIIIDNRKVYSLR